MKATQRRIILLLSLIMMCGAAGCGASPATSSAPAPSVLPAGAAKPVILAVSFGSSYNDTREAAIGAVEKAMQRAYPEYEVRRAFTSQTVIDIIADREKLEIDNVAQAMERLLADGVKDVIVQPTHVMPGKEYDDVAAEIGKYADEFHSLKMGGPLLADDADYDDLIKALTSHLEPYKEEDLAVVFMGHGTHHTANAVYSKLQQRFEESGHDNCFVGTVEATPSLEDVMALVEQSGADKVLLLPLMVTAGDHASNDMAGDEPGSWKTEFEKAGYEVRCILKGLGEYEGVQRMFIEHAASAK